jgi:hypothetical protein
MDYFIFSGMTETFLSDEVSSINFRGFTGPPFERSDEGAAIGVME